MSCRAQLEKSRTRLCLNIKSRSVAKDPVNPTANRTSTSSVQGNRISIASQPSNQSVSSSNRSVVSSNQSVLSSSRLRVSSNQSSLNRTSSASSQSSQPSQTSQPSQSSQTSQTSRPTIGSSSSRLSTSQSPTNLLSPSQPRQGVSSPSRVSDVQGTSHTDAALPVPRLSLSPPPSGGNQVTVQLRSSLNAGKPVTLGEIRRSKTQLSPMPQNQEKTTLASLRLSGRSSGNDAQGYPDLESVVRRLDMMEAKLAQVDKISVQLAQLTEAVNRLTRASSLGDGSERELEDMRKSLEAIRRKLDC